MRFAATNQMLIRVLDEEGRILCMDNNRAFIGALASREVISGQSVQLILTAQDDETESYEIKGEVRAKRKTLVLYSGVEFEVLIAAITRQPRSAPVPTEAFDVQKTQQALQMPANTSSLLPTPRIVEHKLHHDDDSHGLNDSEPNGIYGALSGMSLTELVQSLELNRKTARIDLRPKSHEVGTVFMTEGSVVFASWGMLLGDDAFTALAQHSKGSFRVQFGQEAESHNIDRATPWLILEAARLTDENLRDSGPPPPLAAEHAPREAVNALRSDTGLHTGFSDMGEALISVAASRPVGADNEALTDARLFPELGADDDDEHALDDAFDSVHTRTLSVQEAQKLREHVMALKSSQGDAADSAEWMPKPKKKKRSAPAAFTGEDPFADDEDEGTDASAEGARLRAFHTELSSVEHETREGEDALDLDATLLLPQKRPAKKKRKSKLAAAMKKPAKEPLKTDDDVLMNRPTKVFSGFFAEVDPAAEKPAKIQKRKRREGEKRRKRREPPV